MNLIILFIFLNDQCCFRKMSGYRLPYTIDEDILILNTIYDAEAYYMLRGNNFWKDFANIGSTERPWQSLKERFHKEIIINIFNQKYNIPEYKKRIIYLGWEQTKK